MLTQTRTQPQLQYRLADNDLLMGEQPTQYVLRVKDLPDEDKPREKMLQSGAKNLSTAELVAILWGVGTKKEEVMLMAQRLVKEYGEKALASESNPQRLAEAMDIPIAKACQVVASFELGRRFFATKSGRPIFVRNARQAYQYLRGMADSQKEQLRGLYLNSRYQVVRDEVISVGSLTSNVVHPREVFQPAIEHGAIAVIIAHNHPSGVLEPTDADIAVTQQLIRAGNILGIDLIDHLVIAGDRFISVMDCLN